MAHSIRAETGADALAFFDAIAPIVYAESIDMSVAFADKSDRYRLTIIGRNLTDENFAALITRDHAKWTPVIREGNIRAE